jgi:hypothetical protein
VLPLIVYFYIAIGVWFLIVRPRVFVGIARQAVFLSAFLLGSARWWLANVGQGWPSLHASQLELRTVDGIGRRVLEFFSKGLPCLLGARPTPNYPDLFPGASMIAVLVFTGAALSAILYCVRYRASRGPREHGGPRQARTLLLLLLSIVAMQVVVAYNPDTYLMDPRYLYPFYAPFVLLFGFALTLVGRTRFAWAAIPIVVGVLALNGVSLLRAPRIDLVTVQPADVPLDDLVGALDKLGITDVYTSYWTGYRLAFESEERIRVASFGEGVHRSDRYPPYAKSVTLSRNPGFILWGKEAERFRKYLRARGSGAKSFRVGMYEVFWDVSPAVVREMAELRRVPSDGP